jgi:hypothetical protein
MKTLEAIEPNLQDIDAMSRTACELAGQTESHGLMKCADDKGASLAEERLETEDWILRKTHEDRENLNCPQPSAIANGKSTLRSNRSFDAFYGFTSLSKILL